MDDAADELDSLTSWLIAVIGLVMLVVLWGTIFTFTVYSQALGDAFALSSLRVSAVFSVTTAAFYVAGGLVGVLVARLPLRPVVAAAGVVLALAVGLVQVAASYVGLAVAFALLGVTAGTLYVVLLSVVPQWFERYEGRAMGLTISGNGLGIFVLPPIWGWLLPRFGFRRSFAVVGATLVAIVFVASLFYRRPQSVQAADSTPVDLAWLKRTLAGRRFVAALVGFALFWSWYFVLSSNLVSILSANGVTRSVATAAFGAIGAVSVVARLVSGEVADRLGMRVTHAAGITLAGVALLALPLASSTPVAYAAVLCFGVGLGAIATLFSPILVQRFGPENATAIIGVFTLVEASTAFLVPIGLDLLVRILDGFTVPLVLLAAITLAGGAAFYWGTTPPTGEAA